MMYVEFTELIVGGIQQGKTRRIVINLSEVISFREGPHNSGCILDTRRGDVHVEEKYHQVKELFNNNIIIAITEDSFIYFDSKSFTSNNHL